LQLPDQISQPDGTGEPLAAVIASLSDAVQKLADAHATEALDATDAARLLGVSRAAFYQLDNCGQIPSGITIGTGSIRRWLRSELLAWLKCGAPSRAQWQHQRTMAFRKVG